MRLVDVVVDGPACVHLHGKGRKQRSVPLWKTTVQEIRAWLRQVVDAFADAVLALVAAVGNRRVPSCCSRPPPP